MCPDDGPRRAPGWVPPPVMELCSAAAALRVMHIASTEEVRARRRLAAADAHRGLGSTSLPTNSPSSPLSCSKDAFSLCAVCPPASQRPAYSGKGSGPSSPRVVRPGPLGVTERYPKVGQRRAHTLRTPCRPFTGVTVRSRAHSARGPRRQAAPGAVPAKAYKAALSQLPSPFPQSAPRPGQ